MEDEQDLTGPRALLRLALPSAAFVILTNAYRVVDQYWVDEISVAAQAAVGATMFVLVVAYASFELISAGVGPLVARATGAKDEVHRRTVVGTSLCAAVLLAAAWTVLGGLGAETVAGTLGLGPEAELEASRYLRAIAITCLPLVLTPLMDAVFLSMGDARTPLVLHAVTLAVNLVLTPLFVIQLEAGVSGAAYASTLARALATAWGLWVLWPRLELRRSDLRLHPQLRRVLTIGAPMAWNTALYGGAYWVMLRVAVSPLGPEVNAALGIGWSALEGLSWPLFHGVSLAVASIVGRLLGAGDAAAARRAATSSILPTAVLGLLTLAVFVGAGSLITAPFAQDPDVHREAALYAAIIGYSQPFVALEHVAEGVLAGAGDTRRVFWFSAPFNLARAPLAWWFAVVEGGGSAALWWVIGFTTLIKAILKMGAMIRGGWAELELN